jgi:hypothetical protein
MGDPEVGDVELHGVRFVAVGARFVNVLRCADGLVVEQFAMPDGASAFDHDDLVDAAHRWVRRRVGAEPTEPRRCAACGERLRSATGAVTDSQFADALQVTFSGGYAMFVDAEVATVICGGCAASLCAQHRWIADLLS